MPENDPALVEEGQNALKEVAAQLEEALDLGFTQSQRFLQEAQNWNHTNRRNWMIRTLLGSRQDTSWH